jgi:hypothetical protein
MVPHFAPPSREYSNYYLRPYSPADLRRHRTAAAQWGGDSQDPYSNEIFARIYREFDESEADARRLDPSSTDRSEEDGSE